MRAGFRLILELDGFDVVGEAGDGAEALELARSLEPDVVLMDVRMPRMDGIEATRRIGLAGLRTRVLVLTTFDMDEHVYDALRAGASGFLLQGRGARAADRGRADGGGGRVAVRAARCCGGSSITTSRGRPLGRTSGLDELSERELEVLRLIGRGLSNTEIGEELVISLATVKTHVRHVLAKLGLRDRVQAVVLAYESGLVSPGAVSGESGSGRPPDTRTAP